MPNETEKGDDGRDANLAVASYHSDLFLNPAACSIWHIFNKTVISFSPGCPLISSQLISCRGCGVNTAHTRWCSHTLMKTHTHTGNDSSKRHNIIVFTRRDDFSQTIFMCSADFCWVKVSLMECFPFKGYCSLLQIQYACQHQFFTASLHSQTGFQTFIMQMFSTLL